MATQIVELSGDEAALLRSYDRAVKKQAEYEARLRAGGDVGAAAGSQLEEALKKVNDASDQALKGLLSDLQKAGPQGQAVAGAVKGHFVDAGKAGFQSVDKILARIRAIDPAAADAGEALQREMTAAANSTETQIQDILAEMRALGREGRAAADKMEQGFKEAGKLSSRSIEDVAKAFSKIDPEVAEIAKEMTANIAAETDKAKEPFSQLATHGIEQIKTLAAAFIGVGSLQEAISFVTATLEEQRKKMEEVANTQVKIGEKQQEVFKQSIGTSLVEQSTLLRKSAPDVALSSGIPLDDVLDSFVAVKSAGGTDQQAIAFTSAAGKLNVGSPADTKEFARGAFKLADVGGLTPEEALAFTIKASGPSPIDDPAQLNKQLARGVQAALPFNSAGDARENLRQQAAAINTIGQVTGDATGDSTITANTALNAQMRELFKGRQDDPGRLKERIEKMREDPQLQAKFLDNLRGEEIFKPVFEQLIDKNSKASKLLQENYDANPPGDASAFNQKASQVRAATPQLAAMQLRARSDTALEVARNAQDETGMLSEVRSTVSKAFADTRPANLISNVLDRLSDWTAKGSLEGNTALEEAVSGIAALGKRREEMKADGIQPGELQKIAALDEMIKQIRATAVANVRNKADLDMTGFDSFATQVERDRNAVNVLGGEGVRNVSEDILATLHDIRQALKDVAASNQAMVEPTAAAAASAAETAAAAAETAKGVNKTPMMAGAIGSAAAGP